MTLKVKVNEKVKFTDGQTDEWTDGQAQAMTIPLQPERPRGTNCGSPFDLKKVAERGTARHWISSTMSAAELKRKTLIKRLIADQCFMWSILMQLSYCMAVNELNGSVTQKILRISSWFVFCCIVDFGLYLFLQNDFTRIMVLFFFLQNGSIFLLQNDFTRTINHGIDSVQLNTAKIYINITLMKNIS